MSETFGGDLDHGADQCRKLVSLKHGVRAINQTQNRKQHRSRLQGQ